MKKEDFIKQFARNIQKLRIQEGISLAELGSCSHVPLWMLEELEQGTLPKEMMVLLSRKKLGKMDQEC